MRIGIFGGSFNPPHKMHFSMAKDLLNGYVDKVIYVPTGSKYKYKDNLVDDELRVSMLKVMIKDDERFEVSDFELRERNVYTYETLAYFKELYPNDEILFICGADNLSYVDKWMHGEELLKNNKFLVVRRSSDDIYLLLEKFKEYKENIIVSDVAMKDISSTMIRETLKKGGDVSEYLDEDVLSFIKNNNLYEVR